MFQDLWNKTKKNGNLQYAKNFENVHIPFSMKTKQVCIWILLKPGVQVSIGHCIIENEKKVTGRSKIPQERKNGDFYYMLLRLRLSSAY
jgi:hypothetical protein